MTNKLHCISDAPWYKEGLKFQCTSCGKCCTGSPGAVWLKESDIQKMVQFLHISRKEFLEKYTCWIDGRLSLAEKENYDCIFLQGKFCSIYPARPTQCQTFPFWPNHLKSKADWDALKSSCEGIHEEAETISFEEIERQKRKYLED